MKSCSRWVNAKARPKWKQDVKKYSEYKLIVDIEIYICIHTLGREREREKERERENKERKSAKRQRLNSLYIYRLLSKEERK